MDFLFKPILEGQPLEFTPWQVLYTVVLVLVLYAILDRYLFRPVMAVLDSRAERIEQGRGAADDTSREVDEKARLIDTRLAEARSQSVAELEKAKKAAEQTRDAELQDARARGEQRIAEAAAETEKAARQAESELKSNAQRLAAQVASRLLGREVA